MSRAPPGCLWSLAMDFLFGNFKDLFRSAYLREGITASLPGATVTHRLSSVAFQSQTAAHLLGLSCGLTLLNIESKGQLNSTMERLSPPGVKIFPLVSDPCVQQQLAPVRDASLSRAMCCSCRAELMGFAFFNPREDLLVFIFSGTATPCGWVLDFDYVQRPVAQIIPGAPESAAAHWGFLRGYGAIRHQILKIINSYVGPATQIITSGISLGGALATLLAYDFSAYTPHLYSFAAPAVFNPEGAEDFDQRVEISHRVVNAADLVPFLPLPVMTTTGGSHYLYNQTKGLQMFQRNMGNYSDNHTVAYAIQFGLWQPNDMEVDG